jgi:hypothetical protein
LFGVAVAGAGGIGTGSGNVDASGAASPGAAATAESSSCILRVSTTPTKTRNELDTSKPTLVSRVMTIPPFPHDGGNHPLEASASCARAETSSGWSSDQ